MKSDFIDVASRELWERAKAIYIMSLKTDEEKSQTERYLGMITSVASEGNTFTIYTSTEFAADLIRREYENKLRGSFLVAGAHQDINVVVKFDSQAKPTLIVPSPANNLADQPSSSKAVTSSTFISPMPLNEEYTFDEFVPGPSNSFAIAAAKSVLSNPGKSGYNPLFIHGGTGLGKTHLMQAIGNDLKARNPGMAICYVTAEEYMNEYVNSLANGKINDFKQKYRNVDLLLLDDVQFLQKGKQIQEEFFNTFNSLREKKRQIVMTSDLPPKKLPAIEERLISRFEGGMLQEIESPSYETRLAILKKKCENIEIRIGDNVLEFIADNIKSHVRALEGALSRISVHIMAQPNVLLTNERMKDILKDFIEKETTMVRHTIEEIQQACAKKYSVSMADILSHERTQSIVTPRQMAMFIARKCTSKGLQEIADSFGKKHATIINGVKTIKQRLDNEEELKLELQEVLSSLGYQLSDVMD